MTSLEITTDRTNTQPTQSDIPLQHPPAVIPLTAAAVIPVLTNKESPLSSKESLENRRIRKIKEWQALAQQQGTPLLRNDRGFMRALLITPSGTTFTLWSAPADKLLGKGTSKTVKLAEDYFSPGQLYACAFANLDENIDHYLIQREIAHHKLLADVKSVVRLHAFQYYTRRDTNQMGICMIFDYANCNSLHSLAKKGAFLKIETVRKIVYQLLETMTAIHAKGCVHRDLTDPNVLLHKEGNRYHVLVADLGAMCSATYAKDKADTATTATYAPPEYAAVVYAASQQKIQADCTAVTTDKLDVWAIGCIIFHLCNNFQLPWDVTYRSTFTELESKNESPSTIREQSDIAVFKKISQFEDNTAIDKIKDEVLQSIVSKIFQKDPQKRPCAADLFKELQGAMGKGVTEHKG
jgi:serine/threonine protein kinase